MRTSRQLAILGATGMIVLGALAAGPASAATDGPVVLPSTTSYEQALDWLKDNSGEQTRQSIEATGALAIHVEEYADEQGQVLSAVAVHKPSALQRAVYWTSPGCTTTGACIRSGGRDLGYSGTGSLSGSWSSVTRIAAGNATTGLWQGDVGNFVVKYKATSYAKAISGNKIVRTP
jgi:hypothetical protein